MQNPLLSVIVPVFNTEKYLEKCLLSIINQDYSNMEIIIIDDGSTDGSGTICDIYASKHCNVKVMHQPNAGQSKTRNRGLLEAQGEYVTFVDSDDYLTDTNVFSKLMPLFNYGADLVVYGFQNVDENSNMIQILALDENGMLPVENVIKEFILSDQARGGGYVWNKIFKKRENGEWPKFDVDLFAYEDKKWLIEFLLTSRYIYFSDLCGYAYRSNQNSISRGTLISEERYLNGLQAHAAIRDKLLLNTNFHEFAIERYAWMVWGICWKAIKERNKILFGKVNCEFDDALRVLKNKFTIKEKIKKDIILFYKIVWKRQ